MKKKTAKKKIGMVLRLAMPAALVIAGLFYIGQTATAQNQERNSTVLSQDKPAQQADEQKTAPEKKTFTGKIVKSGDMVVLVDAEGKITYKLDDQQMAKEFVDRDVRVIGVLDNSTGMIRVNSIVPA